MSKKDFNEGAKLGLRLSEDIIKGNIEVNQKIIELAKKLELNIDDFKNLINNIIDTQEEIEIEKLFGIVKIYNLVDLEKEEKIILFQILNEIGKKHEPNEFQKKFKLNLLKYLNIIPDEILEENKIGNFRNILENFENAKALKIIYQTVCEYIYLNKYISLEDYENILSYFYYDQYFKQNIETKIELKVKLFGIEILYEQFQIETNINNNKEKEEEESVSMYEEKKENIEITEECASMFFGDTQKSSHYYIETSTFIIYPIDNKKIISLNKSTLEKIEILEFFKIKDINSLFRNKKISYYNDILYIIIDNNLYYYNLNKLDSTEKKLIFNIKDDLLKKGYIFDLGKYEAKNMTVEKENIIYEYKSLFHYNLKTQKNSLIKEEELNSPNSNCYFFKEEVLYFISEKKEKEDLYSVSYLPSPSSEIQKFSIKRYHVNLNSKYKSFNILDSFIKVTNYIYDSKIKILRFFLYNKDNNNYIVIIGKEDSRFTSSYKRYLVDLYNNKIDIYTFSNEIDQIEQYKDFLVYSDVSNNFKVQKYNIFSNNISTLIDNYSIENKDGSYKIKKEYRRIGKWIIDDKNIKNLKIIDIEK
ncbi:hypothetical protein HMPREF2085_00470 [Fusobacterium nucleatum 13_3C]|uniref:Uncharacterized protein n=1 Tax=Fusobacterium nucleatum 13_3C TaxID=1357398 RepID=X7S9Z0_FUSNU|nr:hypothetical protein [Fusobacterium nucleatum]ETZ29652.1 hypothetical protein HMPREF2085_00470 [Fusobacterium nucleatum 13_3C]